MDLRYWQTALREADAELDPARTRTEINAAAKKSQGAKAALKGLEIAADGSQSGGLAVAERPRALPHDLIGFVDFKARELQAARQSDILSAEPDT